MHSYINMNTTAKATLKLNTPRYLQIIMGIAFSVIFFLGTVGNVLVIYVLGKRKKKVIIVLILVISLNSRKLIFPQCLRMGEKR